MSQLQLIARRQRNSHGVVLLITLIMLVAMTLAGIALIRSVHTTTLIAGNLAIQQSTLASGTAGSEFAVAWVRSHSGSFLDPTLEQNDFVNGYSAQRRVPPAGMSWDTFWTNTMVPQGVVTLAPDSAGNTVQYAIDRMCNGTGPSSNLSISCAVSQVVSPLNNSSKGAGVDGLESTDYVFYRIIARIQGPRNTISFIETMVAM
jgi:type IV pilus assembly protein PilX